MKRIISVFVLFLCFLSFLSASSSLSVALDSDAYRIIDMGEIRGIIPVQPDTRPYTLTTVRNLLDTIYSSDKISESEKSAVEAVLRDLERSYGVSSEGSLLEKGYVAIEWKDVSVAVGAKAESIQRVGFLDKAFDSRNTLIAYIRSEMFNKVSLYMDLRMLFNKLDHRAFLVTDFSDNCDGFYLTIKGGGGANETLSPFSSLKFGTGMNPELSSSFFDNRLVVRFASIKRDWGPGINNLGLSKSASSFDGIEFSLSPASWLNFSVAVGSLGKSYVKLSGEADPVTGSGSGVYDNNLSIQRIEIEPLEGLRASIYESVIWRKRFELAYMNPLGVYMFSQNYIGDYDNMLIGLDASYTWKGVGKFYTALAIDEINSCKLFWARNIISYQFGAEFSLPIGDFTSLSLQTTYVSPFFGTHYVYRKESNPWGNTDMGTAYINKGSTLSYPLYPDSLEFLVSLSATVSSWDFDLDFVIKDQMRSAQYATEEKYGTTLNTIFNYRYADNVEKYAKRDFFSYIWNNTLDIEVNASKGFDSFPLELNLGLQCLVKTVRSYDVSAVTEWDVYEHIKGDSSNGKEMKTNPGNLTKMGDDWSTTASFNVLVGFSLYY